jgi:hypothetical protein
MRGVSAILVGLIAAVGLAAAGPARLSAASPSPSAPPSEPLNPEPRPELQVWLDQPAPEGVQPGDELEIGATVWDATARQIANVGATIYLHAVPVDEAVEPSTATAIRDWPGHYRGTVSVPASGLGRLELGVTGTLCVNDVCAPMNNVFEIAGDGPPPEAPITSLASARVDVDPAGLIAKEATEISVILTPNAAWPSLPVPDELVLRVREPRGPNLAVATLPLVDRDGLVYAGAVTLPVAGSLVLEVATDAYGGDATRFATSMVPVEVAEAPDTGDDVPEAATDPGDEGLPPIMIALLAVAAVAGVGVILAGFRSGSR